MSESASWAAGGEGGIEMCNFGVLQQRFSPQYLPHWQGWGWVSLCFWGRGGGLVYPWHAPSNCRMIEGYKKLVPGHVLIDGLVYIRFLCWLQCLNLVLSSVLQGNLN
jgi:hypothetical protein